jgi:hypothetical protein
MADETGQTIEFLFTGDSSEFEAAADKVADIWDELPSKADAASDEISAANDRIVESLSTIAAALEEAAQSFSSFSEETANRIQQGNDDISASFDDLTRSLDDAQDKFNEFASESASSVEDFGQRSRDGFDSAGGAADDFSTAISEAREAAGLFTRLVGGELPGELGVAALAIDDVEAKTSLLARAFGAIATVPGAIITGLTALTAVGVGSALTMYKLADNTAEAQHQFALMSEKTGLSLSSLNALKVGAELADTSMQRIVMSITQLQYRLERSSGARGAQAKFLQDLKIDTRDANVALEQLFKLIAEKPAEQRTAFAMQIFGPRFGRDWGLLVAEMGADFDKFKAKLKEWGIEIDPQTVAEAKKFHDQTVMMGNAWDSLKTKIAAATFPTVTKWMEDLGGWLVRNQDEIVKFGKNFVNALSMIANGLVDATKALTNFSTKLAESKSTTIPVITTQDVSKTTSNAEGIRKIYESGVNAESMLGRLAHGAENAGQAINKGFGENKGVLWLITRFQELDQKTNTALSSMVRLAAWQALGPIGSIRTLNSLLEYTIKLVNWLNNYRIVITAELDFAGGGWNLLSGIVGGVSNLLPAGTAQAAGRGLSQYLRSEDKSKIGFGVQEVRGAPVVPWSQFRGSTSGKEGVKPPSSTRLPGDGGGGGGGGGANADQEIARQISLEQMRLRLTMVGIQSEENQYKESLAARQTGFTTWVGLQLGLEAKRHETVMASYTNEAIQIDKLKDKKEKESKVLELEVRRAEEVERYRSANANLVQQAQDFVRRVRDIYAEGQLKFGEAVGRGQMDQINDNAKQRIITEEQAAQQISVIEIGLAEARIEDLKRQKIEEIDVYSQHYQELTSQLTVAEQELVNLRAKRSRDERDAAERDAETRRQEVREARDWADGIIDANMQVQQEQLRARGMQLDRQIRLGMGPSEAMRAGQALDIRAEDLRWQQQQLQMERYYRDRIEKQEDYARKNKMSEEWLAARRVVLENEANAAIEAARASHIEILKGIWARQAEALHNAMREMARDMTSTIHDAIHEGFDKGIKAGLKSFAIGILEMIESAMMRKLEQALTKIFDKASDSWFGDIAGWLFGIGKKTGGKWSDIAKLVPGIPTGMSSTSEVTGESKEGIASVKNLWSSVNKLYTGTDANTQATLANTGGLSNVASVFQSMTGGSSSGGWASILGTALGIVGGIAGALPTGGAGSALSIAQQYTPVIPRMPHQTGLDFVPYDNYPASLHRGERVVPAWQNTPNNKNGGGTTVNMILHAPVLGGSSHQTPKSRREYLMMLEPIMREALRNAA